MSGPVFGATAVASDQVPLKCHFCGRSLPEEWASHIILAKGFLHAKDPSMPDYPVCGACLKYHGLKVSALRRKP